MNRLVRVGLRHLFGGARKGQPALAGLGAALSIIGWFRSRRRGRELLFSRNLRDGETLKIRLVRGEAVLDEAEIGG